MTNRRLVDPRLHYTFRLTGAEYHLIFKHWPAPGDSPGGKQILRSDWMRRMILLAADAADREPRILSKLINDPTRPKSR